MYTPKTIHSGYIGILQEHQIPMYSKKEYIGTAQKQAIPMYPTLKNTPNLSDQIRNPDAFLCLSFILEYVGHEVIAVLLEHGAGVVLAHLIDGTFCRVKENYILLIEADD